MRVEHPSEYHEKAGNVYRYPRPIRRIGIFLLQPETQGVGSAALNPSWRKNQADWSISVQRQSNSRSGCTAWFRDLAQVRNSNGAI